MIFKTLFVKTRIFLKKNDFFNNFDFCLIIDHQMKLIAALLSFLCIGNSESVYIKGKVSETPNTFHLRNKETHEIMYTISFDPNIDSYINEHFVEYICDCYVDVENA